MSDDAEQESTDTEAVSRQELIEFLGDSVLKDSLR